MKVKVQNLNFISRLVLLSVLALLLMLSNPLTAYASRRDDLVGLWIAYSPVGNGWGDSGIRWDFWSNGTWVRINENNQGTRVYGTWELDGSNTLTLRAGNFGWENDTRFHTIRWENTNRVYVTLSGSVNPNLVLTSQSRPHADVPHTHTPGNWVAISEATCTEIGHRERRCTVCDDVVYTESIPALDHALSGEWVTLAEPTCADLGQRVQYCTECREIALDEEIPTLPHTPDGEWITLTDEPTCADEEVQLCEECGEPALTRASTIPHTPSGNWIVYEEPDCNTPGRRVQYCVICGDVAIDRVIPAITGLDHEFTSERISGNIFIPPIVTEYTCEVCGYDGGIITSWALAWVSPSILAGFGLTGFMTVKMSKRGSRKNTRITKERVSMSKFICPFCMKEYPKTEIAHSCSSCRQVAGPQTKCKESGCTGYVSVQRCPHCEEALPYIALETPNFPFSIVGVSGAGKTNYITVMLEELKNFDGLQLALNHQNNEAMEHQRDNYKRLYKDRTPPPANYSGEVKPQIWYLQNLSKRKKSLFGQEHIPAYSFTIFDGSGEDYLKYIDNPDMDSPAALAVFRSKGILLVLDPLTLSNILDGEGGVDAETIRNSLGRGKDEVHTASDVINGISLYLKRMSGIKPSKKLNIPVAVILTKFDAIWDHPAFGPNALVKHKKLGITNGKVNWNEIDQVHEEIKHWLYAVGENGFVKTLEANFKDYKLFGVSSYGKPPASEHELSVAPEPHRVLDPILWLFKQKGAGFID